MCAVCPSEGKGGGGRVQEEKMRPFEAEAAVWAQTGGYDGAEHCGKGRCWGAAAVDGQDLSLSHRVVVQF